MSWRGKGSAIPIDHAGLHELSARFARTLAMGYHLDEVIEQLGAHIRCTLDVAGAGVMVEDEQRDLRFLSTSDETLRTLEQLQVRLDEGPCLQAYRTGKQVIASDLRDDPRFQQFGPLAVAAGMLAVYSFPMVQGDMAIGAMNLYRATPGPLTEEQVSIGQMFAEIATAFIVHARLDDQQAMLNRQLQAALDSRVAIEQAKGFVMARRGVDARVAFEALRRHARNQSRPLRDVAREVLDGDLEVGRLPVDV